MSVNLNVCALCFEYRTCGLLNGTTYCRDCLKVRVTR